MPEIKKLPISADNGGETDPHNADHGPISSSDSQADVDRAVAEKKERPPTPGEVLDPSKKA